MTALLIAEELFLLTHDDESGKSSSGMLSPDTATAGALLLDLAEEGVMKVEGKLVVVADETVSHPLLADTLAVIAGSDKPRSVSHWVNGLSGKLKPVQDRVGDSLVSRGVLDREDGKVMGLFKTTRWPERDPAPERELRTGLADVLVRGATPSTHQSLLIPLLHGLDLVPKLVEKDDRKAAKATAKELAKAAKDGQLVSSAVSQTVAATQAAILMVIMMPAITTTIASN